MADLERPERITNITGLRAQPDSTDAPAGPPTAARAGRMTVPCRLCRRPVWLFARRCVCGMTDPARDARRPYVAPVLALATTLAAATWWWLTRR